jgi:serine/threonine-protein kinase RsbW
MTSIRDFPNDPTAVRAARRFALESLSGQSAELLEVVELLVSELATNAVRHTDSGFSVRVEQDARRIRISVTDHGGGHPEVQGLDPEAISGRGLALVEMFSREWGVRPSRSAEGGKTVWLELDATGAPEGSSGGRAAGRESGPPSAFSYRRQRVRGTARTVTRLRSRT